MLSLYDELTSHLPLPEFAWPSPITKTETNRIEIEFEQGEPVGLNGERMNPVQLIKKLEALASPYGIGRNHHVGDTIIGIKGRVGFEAAAPMVLIESHRTLEKHCLAKWQLYWKDQVASFYGNWLHEGQFLDPVMRDLEVMMESTQQMVTGKVFLTLHPYRYVIDGIHSEHDLMSAKFGHYGEMNNTWTGEDVRGFAKIFGNQNAIYHQLNNTL